ncbi:MAG: DUF4179 domain-containing protein [Clostridia bacterium]|nr:DUF4179 domain-containing protein [Clostridia bacterium]
MRKIHSRRILPVRMALVLAAVLTVLLALGCAGYAEYNSGLLSRLFGSSQIRPEAADLLMSEPVSMSRNGITVTIIEYLYDGQTMHIAGEMRNDTGEALLCGMKPTMGDSGPGVFGLGGNGLVLIQPGETADGWVKLSEMNPIIEAANQWQVNILAVALKPNTELRPDVNDTDYYSTDRHYNTELTETVFEETLSFPMEKNLETRPSRTVPGTASICMEEYGYTIVMRKANFAAASSVIEFDLVPAEQADIMAYGDEGADGRGRLYRHYCIMIPDDNGEMSRLRTDGSFGWTRNKTRLGYHLSCGPLPEVPEQILLVPTDHENNPITDEAVTIPVIPSIFPF